jgi:hypothetical protein
MGARKDFMERETVISVLLGGDGCKEGIFREKIYNLSFIGGLWVQGRNF